MLWLKPVVFYGSWYLGEVLDRVNLEIAPLYQGLSRTLAGLYYCFIVALLWIKYGGGITLLRL